MQDERPIKNKTKRAAPFPLRLSEEEKSALVQRAGNMALGSYIKAQLFDEEMTGRLKKRQRIVRSDQKLLAQILAVIAAGRLKDRLDELAELGRNGGLAFDSEAPRRLQQACDDIHAMRVLLMRALGFRERQDAADETLSQTFLRADMNERTGQ